MKSVNIKSKAKPPLALGGWGKYTFTFDSIEVCNTLALPIAAYLRSRFPKVYYARYTGALESRLDVYVYAVKLADFDRFDFRQFSKQVRWKKIEGPTTCPGSDAHAAGFDAVLRCVGAFSKMTPDERRAQFNDVVHWMQNMMGYDYVDEVRNHLHAIHCVMGVFEQSIRLGNKMSKAAKKAGRTKGVERN